jgi:rubrerythrin
MKKNTHGYETPFSGAKNSRQLKRREFIKAIRFMLSPEYDGIRVYMKKMKVTDNKLVKEILKDTSDKKHLYAGEFLRLLKYLTPD